MRRKGIAGCCLLTTYLDLSRRYKALDSLSKVLFCWLLFLIFLCPNYCLQIFTLVFISKVTHGKDFNFSSRHLQYEILSFSVPRGCNGKADDLHVIACSSEHELMQKKKFYIVWSRCCRLEEEECIDSVLEVHTHGLLPWLSVFKFIFVFVSQPKPSPSQHTYFRFTLQS